MTRIICPYSIPVVFREFISGVIISLISASLFMFTAIINSSPFLICAAMVVFTAGITLAGTIYGMESANVFPKMRGIATGMSNALRHVIVAGIVGVGSYGFNGSIMPVALLIMITSVLTVFLAIALVSKKGAISIVTEGV